MPSFVSSTFSHLLAFAVDMNTRASVCRSFWLADVFGDGWGSAALHVSGPSGGYSTYAPTYLQNPVSVDICFDLNSNQDGDTFTASVRGFEPQQAWEVIICINSIESSIIIHFVPLLQYVQILWLGTILPSNTVYTGGFLTSMTFELHVTNTRAYITLEMSENLLPNVLEW